MVGNVIWAFRSQANGRFVARGGLRQVDVEGALEVELAYAVMSDSWGQGLATEMAQAILGIGFEHLALSNVVGFTLVSNRASQRVLEKAGFSFERNVVHADLPHVLYRIARSAHAQQMSRERDCVALPDPSANPKCTQ